MQILATIDYDIFFRDGIRKHSNTGYIDRTKIFQELLRLNLGEVVMNLGTEDIYIPADSIHEIRYTINKHKIVIDCAEFYRKRYDKIGRCPIEKEGYERNTNKRKYKISSKGVMGMKK